MNRGACIFRQRDVTRTGIAQSHDLFVVEDAAQAIGSKYNGRQVGALGDTTNQMLGFMRLR
jgi:DegT/DnrJ/EryC1/StrS aminotransferase family